MPEVKGSLPSNEANMPRDEPVYAAGRHYCDDRLLSAMTRGMYGDRALSVTMTTTTGAACDDPARCQCAQGLPPTAAPPDRQ